MGSWTLKLAKDDVVITEGELKFLDNAARRLNISQDEYAKILKHPEKYPINPPVNYDERIERLFRLSKMVVVDGKIDLHEVKLMRKIAVGLHFDENNVEKVCD